MSRPKVFIAERIPEKIEQYIGGFCDYEKWDSEVKIPREILLEKLVDKDGLLITGNRIDNELLERAPRLKVVSNISVGYNNFDLEAMKNRGVLGTNTPFVLDDTVADLIFALMLSASRRIVELDKHVRENKWSPRDDENLYGLDVHHATLGIIGMGRIGEAVARRAKLGFGMDVIYYNRNRKEEVEKNLGARYLEMDLLLQESDFIVLMTPLTKDTYHLIDKEQFNRMKNTAVFVNASRGQTVNEKALIEALQNKKIYAAGLDVYEVEPINPDNPLLKMPNVVLLPHIGSATEKTRYDMCKLAAENMVAALVGEITENVVPELR